MVERYSIGSRSRTPASLRLGGADGQTLSCNVPDWHLDDDFVDDLRRLTTGRRTGQVLTANVEVPAGWPNSR
jgi:hypothetical protein